MNEILCKIHRPLQLLISLEKSDHYLPICSQTTVVVTSHLKSLLYTETSIYVNIIQGVVTTMRWCIYRCSA